jgi:HAD superfamily hydrolase (TIGR01509 family)
MIQAVVFDWGDTVMRNLPGYSGPMVHWPVVEVVPGVEETLRTLHATRKLALATNARDSGTELVRAALRRVGLETHFDFVLTARDLGAGKPDPRFFQALLARLGSGADETVMVGDDYQTDVIGAKEAGLKAVWFNETGVPCPHRHPLHDAEVTAMADLPAAIENLCLPDVAHCLALLAEQDVPDLPATDT